MINMNKKYYKGTLRKEQRKNALFVYKSFHIIFKRTFTHLATVQREIHWSTLIDEVFTWPVQLVLLFTKTNSSLDIILATVSF